MVTKEIRSVQHPLVKEWVALRTDRKAREQAGLVLVSGRKLVSEVPIETYITSHPGEKGIFVTEAVMKKITGLEAPDGYAGLARIPPFASLEKAQRILVLDRVSDPGNLGTLLRTALAFGWDGAWLLPGTCDPFNDKALRAARGATFRLPLSPQTTDGLANWKGRVFVADVTGDSIASLHVKPPFAFVLSHEGEGANPSLGRPVTIPIAGIESLNVASAGAILLYLFRGNP